MTERFFENETVGLAISEKADEIALRATEMPEFKNAMNGAPGKLEAIKRVRELLQQLFPEIRELPKPLKLKKSENIPGLRQGNPLGGELSNEFLIAREIVNLLYKKER